MGKNMLRPISGNTNDRHIKIFHLKYLFKPIELSKIFQNNTSCCYQNPQNFLEKCWQDKTLIMLLTLDPIILFPDTNNPKNRGKVMWNV